MSDLMDQVTADQDPLKKLLSKVPGFNGFIERQNRRAADALLRETIALKFHDQWKRVSELQQEFASAGELAVLDDLETAATKIQTFIDKIQNAARGYSSFFDAVKVNEEELAKIYEFDAALLDMADGIGSAIDNVQSSVGTDGLPAAVRHLVSMARDLVSTFDQRDEVVKGVQ
ncbi:MAG: hypothetical protein EPO32_04505 [Anaerolineae bacterium]|nr:MAG: hypothetical protein EPO32_04505 [Anaerolineae bacterium]